MRTQELKTFCFTEQVAYIRNLSPRHQQQVPCTGFSSPLSYVFWRMRLAVRKKWQIQVRSGNCVCPIKYYDG